ncbi:hypothetical protein ANN_02750 [Periplaneta americana]|uniref:Uncharacterized protein n=1 Tax=Periplaneta americana TaxID=6978 RepID=A0ABQ8TX53_PERAM|nr:hypothetical protein ANN_02750 [Periplaneta americana]
MDLREVGYDDRDWINVEQDRDRRRGYVRAAMNLRVPYKHFSPWIDGAFVCRGIDCGMFFWLRMQQIQAHELRTDAIDLRRLQNNITDRRRIRSPLIPWLQWRYTSTDWTMCSERSDGVLKRVFVREGDILSIFSRQLTISLPSLNQTDPLGVESNGDRYESLQGKGLLAGKVAILAFPRSQLGKDPHSFDAASINSLHSQRPLAVVVQLDPK